MFCLSIFSCCRWFLTCNSKLSFHPGNDFLSVVFRGIPILSQTNFVLAYIKSFNSVMFVEILISKLITFTVSVLTVLQFWFLRKYIVVFISDKILFMSSTFIFPSEISIGAFVFVVFRSLSLSVWFWSRISWFSVFIVSVTVLGVRWSFCLYICCWISSNSRLKANHSLLLS